jgi:hypothetical protein
MTATALIPADWELPEAIASRLGDRVGRQRTMVADGHVLLVLHAPPERDERQRRPRLFWRNPEGVWRSTNHGNDERALAKHLTEFEQLVETFSRAEDLGDVELLRRTLEGTIPVQRSISHLHQALQDARQAVPDDRLLINFRDQAYDLERSADILLQDVRHDLEFAAARHEEQQTAAAHQMAVAAHRLNVMAALFFPLATISAVMGMNFVPTFAQYVSPHALLAAIVGGSLLIGGIIAASLPKPK